MRNYSPERVESRNNQTETIVIFVELSGKSLCKELTDNQRVRGFYSILKFYVLRKGESHLVRKDNELDPRMCERDIAP